MRHIRGWAGRVLAPVVALSVLQACGGEDGAIGEGAGPSTETAGQTNEALASDAGIDPALTKTLHMTFTVDPGTEAFICQTFANPWGVPVDVKTYSTSMSAGIIDMVPFYAPNATSGSPVRCAFNESGELTFIAPSRNASLSYPSNVGARIPKATGFNTYVHAVNTGTTTLTVTADLTMQAAAASSTTKHAGIVWLENGGISVPPGQTVTSTSTYALPQAIKVFAATGEMTHFGQSLSLMAGTTQLFYTPLWDPAIQPESSTISLASGTTLTWSCQTSNPSSSTLTFGESAVASAKCRGIAFFYPASDVNNPRIGAITF